MESVLVVTAQHLQVHRITWHGQPALTPSRGYFPCLQFCKTFLLFPYFKQPHSTRSPGGEAEEAYRGVTLRKERCWWYTQPIAASFNQGN